jgi:hypothetical protein
VCQLLQCGTARIAKPKHARNLVEGLSGRIVEGLSEQLIATVITHSGEQRVATAGH